MDYLYSKVGDAFFALSTPQRVAFLKHLKLVAKALRAIEWNDSGDGDDTEEDAIMACIAESDVLAAAIVTAEKARQDLEDTIALAKA